MDCFIDWESFEKTTYQSMKDNAYMFTKFGDVNLLDFNIKEDNANESNPESVALFFGSETKGLHKLVPENIMKAHKAVFMPMINKGHRQFDTPSFNLATSVSIAMWETYRQINRK